MRAARLTAALCACAAALPAAAAAAPASEAGPSAVRSATAQFHRLAAARDAGYGLFTDAQGIACIDNPGVGAMGVHYVRGDIVGDGAIDARTPEALVYEPQDNGRLRLVAVEYVVFQQDWDATHDTAPSLFGREFEAVGAGNRYGLPPFYALHAWVWKDNPRGMFDDWNPRVRC